MMSNSWSFSLRRCLMWAGHGDIYCIWVICSHTHILVQNYSVVLTLVSGTTESFKLLVSKETKPFYCSTPTTSGAQSLTTCFYFLINRGRKVNGRRERWNNGAEADLKEPALDFEDGRSCNPRNVASGLSVAPLGLCLGPVTPFSHFLLPEL